MPNECPMVDCSRRPDQRHKMPGCRVVNLLIISIIICGICGFFLRTRVSLVLRPSVDRADARQVPTGLHLLAPRSTQPHSHFHLHSDPLLRRHVGHQKHQSHFNRFPCHGIIRNVTISCLLRL